MNPDEAKRILLAVRPGSRDAEDPQVAAALEQVRGDSSTKLWFEKHLRFQSAMQQSFRQAPLPSELCDRILSRSRIVQLATWWHRPVWWAAAAGILLLLTVGGLWIKAISKDPLAVYRSRMVRTALREYRMDVVTNDMAQIRNFLAANGAPADYQLSGGLAKLAPVGAGLLSWQGRRVSMVCLDSGVQDILFLFILDRSAIPRPPPPEPELVQVGKLMTASWTQGGNVYVLAVPGDSDAARKFF
ncbi:MAG: hypothetical protein HY735_08620 [Verrucomicrobia bacterium]|nr:hypothetical protein [Verrucomicrobiota bacterium]